MIDVTKPRFHRIWISKNIFFVRKIFILLQKYIQSVERIDLAWSVFWIFNLSPGMWQRQNSVRCANTCQKHEVGEWRGTQHRIKL